MGTRMRRAKLVRTSFDALRNDLILFSSEFFKFLLKKSKIFAFRMEKGKGTFVTSLYKQRGKLSRKFMHSGMAGLTAFGLMVAPIVAEEFPADGAVDPWNAPTSASVLSASTSFGGTDLSGFRGEIADYVVVDGDTIS
jgi:hypothetical protein